MMELLSGLTGMEKFYAACALLGGALFLVRTVMMFAGHTGDLHAGVDLSEVHADADTSFTYLSLQSLTAFFMMFGLVALAISHQSGLSAIWAVMGGLLAGVATVWLIGRIFMGMKKLQSDGTLKIENAVGQEGTVYLNIPAGKTGQVRITVQGQLRIFDATTDGGLELKTGERIKVVRVLGGSVLVVARN